MAKGKKHKKNKISDISIQVVENGFVLYGNGSKNPVHKIFTDPHELIAELETILLPVPME